MKVRASDGLRMSLKEHVSGKQLERIKYTRCLYQLPNGFGVFVVCSLETQESSLAMFAFCFSCVIHYALYNWLFTMKPACVKTEGVRNRGPSILDSRGTEQEQTFLKIRGESPRKRVSVYLLRSGSQPQEWEKPKEKR